MSLVIVKEGGVDTTTMTTKMRAIGVKVEVTEATTSTVVKAAIEANIAATEIGTRKKLGEEY